MVLHQLDVNNMFLYGELAEEVYMTIHEGYSPRGETRLPSNAVCKLNKSLYGLKQASRQWYAKFSSVLIEEGFCQSTTDHSLFIQRKWVVFIALLMYVDNIIIASDDELTVQSLKSNLDAKFKLKDLGPLRFFLGLEIARTRQGILISQKPYDLQILADNGFLGCKPATTLMEVNVKLSQEDREDFSDPILYRRLIGKLLYLTITRLNLSYAVNKLSRFLSKPRLPHFQTARRILQYVKGTPGQGLFFPSSSSVQSRAFAEAQFPGLPDVQLKVFSNTDWASCPDTRRSVSGFFVFLGEFLISWNLEV